ncbi:response regulator containing a CheY-like receiver domain and an HTH DNA-binding domain [Bradyrhizobium sp. YR681]|uniref:response regulator transcription factor n=1 Tax=Bradyrhizobium sp. YR681 TaxID=1144344 RepID=UPI0002712392|nr:LuxR C-terminal-related transcriptional regulator [Bradyrhizobium sp. YR681]EJN11724.1 response regulator containing a CheY-like receiver domain and an HTH DNA-binding domain [Bradyrhizobium sp. YR681]
MSPDPKDSITPTPRERELMMLIARGMQNKNIAYELKISENTVRAHIGNIMRKYRLQNRTQIAIIYALRSAPLSLRRDLTRNGASPAAVKPAQALAQNPRVPTAPE